MADRSVVVRLRAEIGDLKAKLAEVEKSIDGVTAKQAEAGAAAAEASGEATEAAADSAIAYDTIAASLLAIGGAALAGFGLAVNAFMNFDAEMSAVQAATGASADVMDQLGEAALQAGADTSFSATEAADAITQLAKAGLSAEDIIGGGLAGALDLAAAGEIDVATAADIAATAMAQFGLNGADVTHIADLLAAGAGKAQGEVTDMGMALKQAGLVASQTGLSIEETTGGLAAFARAGLIGSDAGTSFRSMLQRLTPQSEAAAAEMDRLGISAYDSQGQFIGLSKFAGNLQGALQDLTPEQRNAAMAIIFGSDAVRAANVLYEEGAQGIGRWVNSVDDAGFAAEQARAKTDNLRGDLERLSGAWETALIKTGTSADGPLRGVVQRLDALVSAYAAAGEGAQAATVWTLGTVGAVGLVGGAAMLAIPKVLAFEASLATMGATGARSAAMLAAMRGALVGPWGLALAGATIALGVWAEQQYKAAQYVADLSASLDKQTGAISDSTREIVKNDLAAQDGWWVFKKDSAFDAADKLGLSLEDVTDAAMGNADAMARVNAELDVWRDKVVNDDATRERDDWAELQLAIERVDEAVVGNNESLGTAADKTKQKAEADRELVEGEDGVSAAMTAATESIEAQEQALKDLDDALSAIFDQAFSVQEAEDDLLDKFDAATEAIQGNQEALDAATESGDAAAIAAQGNALALDGTSKSARTNRDSLLSLAEGHVAVLQAMADSGAGTDVLNAKALSLKEQFYLQAEALGFTREQVSTYAAEFDNVPALVSTLVEAQTAAAELALSRLVSRLSTFDGSVYTSTVRTTFVEVGTGATRSRVERRVGESEGGILSFFAEGSENHIAQIAPAGAMRVWAEPETLGEAYIPLAPAKRGRSVEITRSVADLFGYDMVPRRQSVTSYAEGGVNGRTAASSITHGPTIRTELSGTFYSYDPTTLVRQAELKARDAAAVHGLSMVGG